MTTDDRLHQIALDALGASADETKDNLGASL